MAWEDPGWWQARGRARGEGVLHKYSDIEIRARALHTWWGIWGWGLGKGSGRGGKGECGQLICDEKVSGGSWS